MPRVFLFRSKFALDILINAIVLFGGVIVSVTKRYVGFLARNNDFGMTGIIFDVMEVTAVARNLIFL